VNDRGNNGTCGESCVDCQFSTYMPVKLLRSQGLAPKQLQTVFTALILSCITYAIAVCGGHLTNQQR